MDWKIFSEFSFKKFRPIFNILLLKKYYVLVDLFLFRLTGKLPSINLSVLDGAWISVIRVTLSMNLVLLCSPQTSTLTNPIHSSARRIFLRFQNSSYPLLMHYRYSLYLVRFITGTRCA